VWRRNRRPSSGYLGGATEIVKRQPDIQPIIAAVIDAGGDIEIAAHNQAGKISFALAEPSGLRHVLLADARQLLE
jgi:hypothetical protein